MIRMVLYESLAMFSKLAVCHETLILMMRCCVTGRYNVLYGIGLMIVVYCTVSADVTRHVR